MVKIVWRKGALAHLKKNYNYIKKDSFPAAQKMLATIFETIEDLKYHPEIFPLDKYRKNNPGNIRAFEKYNLRIAYQVTKTEIRIIRVRHTSRDPLDY